MNENNEKNNILKFQRGFQVNIGFFIMAIIALYIGFHVFTSVTKKNITIYEVEAGTIVNNNSHQALAIREENIINADHDGYVYYFGRNKSRVGMKSLIYAIDVKGDLANLMKSSTDEDIVLGAHDLRSLSSQVDAFIHDFNNNDYQDVYSFKSNLEENLMDIYSMQVQQEYAEQIASATSANTFLSYKSQSPGLLSYIIDGYEGTNLENFDSGSFDIGSIEYKNLRIADEVEKDAPVYKLITSDDWNLVMPIDKKLAKNLEEVSNIQIKFLADNTKTWAVSSIIDKGGDKYLVLSLDDSMERYADQRFVNIELMLDSERGLKIPNTAITKKDFYVINKDYFLKGADKDNVGLIVRRDGKDDFVSPTIYYETDTEYYIDGEYLSPDDKIIMEGTSRSYKVGSRIAQLEGVYSVNKGYTIFKRIDIAYQNEDYSIVKTGTNYGIAMYDYIVLQADTVNENEIIN